MAFITITKPSVGDPTTKDFIDDIVDNQVTLNTQSVKIGLVPNDSFELDEDSDGNPDGWEFTDYTGGSHAIDTTNHAHGAQGIKFTSTVLANGGGYGDLIDYIAIAEAEQYAWKVWRKASVINISCQMTMTWYTNAKVSISTSTLFQDTNTATAYTLASGIVVAPATARFCKLRVEGGVPAIGTATGDITFDGVGLETHHPGSIGQVELKTTNGTVSTTSGPGVDLILPGGAFGYYLELKSSSAAWYALWGEDSGSVAQATGKTKSTTYVTTMYLATENAGVTTATARQTYVQASPPYNLGNGDVPIFVFMVVDNGTGAVESTYIAEDPPWANNGPTSLKQRRELILPSRFKEVKTPAQLLKYRNALRDRKYRNVEITQAIKQADMPLIPHPFQGNDLTGKTIVLIDPVGFADTLHQMHLAGEDVAELLHSGDIILDNRALTANTPPGVQASRAKFKLT